MAHTRVLVLGATGGTGRQVVAQAVEQGYGVTVLVRNQDRLAGQRDRLQVMTGDVAADGPELTQAIRGQDAVISTLGVGQSLKPGDLISRSVPRILQAMDREGVRRLIFTSAFGVGETWRDTPFFPRQMIRFLLRDIYVDKEAGDRAIRRSGLDWTLVHPTRLTDRPRTGQYRVGEHLDLRGIPWISRGDLADFLVKQVADTTYLRRGVLISS